MADNPTAETPATPTAPAFEDMPLPPPSSPTADSPDEAFDQVFQDEADAAPAPKEPEASPEPEAEAETPAKPEAAPGIDRDALTKALGVLRRDNVPQKIIDQLLNDPAELLAWAEKAGKRQGDIDKRLRGEQPETEAKDTTEEPKADPKPGPPATDEALAELVRPFADEMGSEYAEEALTKLAHHVRESTIAEVAPVLEQFQRQMQAMASMLEASALREARASLRERFPQVEDDAAWSKVMERARVLSGTGGYQDIEGMVEDAARLELADLTVRERQKALARKHAARSNGTPTTPTRARKSAPTTPDEIRESILDDIFSE